MRRTALACLTAATVIAAAAPAAAHPTVELDPTLPTDVTFAATDNVTHLGRFPEHTGTAGGRLVGDVFYVTDPRGVHAYDVSDPASPTLLGSLELHQVGTGAALAQEDPDTDGEILLVDGAPTPDTEAELHVIDVSDPTSLEVLSTVPLTAHTWTCVTHGDDACAYAYSREGYIVDLRDPSEPRQVSPGWREAVGYGTTSDGSGGAQYAHDLTEIRPGLVMTAGRSAILMDTTDPEHPVELARIDGQRRFSQLGYHSVEWSNAGADPFAILGTEIAPAGPTNLAGSDCVGDESVIETWDASEIVAGLAEYDAGADAATAFAGREFRRIDAYDAGGRGLFLDGAAPAHLLYCAHWMEPHPAFDAGGKVVVSYYDRGTRFLEVDADGVMHEIGWIVPAEGYSGSAQWIASDDQGDIVYIMDYRRGLEIVRLAPTPATEVYSQGHDVIAAGSSVEPASPLGERVPGFASGTVGLALIALEVLRRRRTAVRAAAA